MSSTSLIWAVFCQLIVTSHTKRIKSASAAFGRLSSRVFFNHNLTIDTKVAVYKAMCISVLLCGSESWTLYRRHFKALEAYHVKCLQAILGVRWWHKVTHSDLRRRAKVQSMDCMVMQRQLAGLDTLLECHQTVCLDASSTLSSRKAVAPVVVKWNVFPTMSSFCWRNVRYRPVSSTHSPLIDLYGVMSVKMVLPHSPSTTIRRQKLAGFVTTPSPRRRQPAHAATSVTESVPQTSDCAVNYASTIVHPQLASTVSLSTSMDSYKQASKHCSDTSEYICLNHCTQDMCS